MLQTTVKDELKHYRRNHQFQFFHDVFDAFYKVKSAPVDWFGISLVFVEAALLFSSYHLGDENTYVVCLSDLKVKAFYLVCIHLSTVECL